MNAKINRTSSPANEQKGAPRLKKTVLSSSIIHPARLLLTNDNQIFIEVTTLIPSKHVPRTLGAKLVGPIDPKEDPTKYLDYAEQDLAQTQAEISRVFLKIASLGKIFAVLVDLHDLRKNFDAATAALEAKDTEALRKLCPEPSFE